MMKTYSELIKLKTFEERFKYLKLDGVVGFEKFGHLRYLNQRLYTSDKYREARRKVLDRDKGLDLGVEGYEITGYIFSHHIIPVTVEMLLDDDPLLYDPENMISCSDETHKAIHYKKDNVFDPLIKFREPGDTKLWKGVLPWKNSKPK